MHLSDNHAYMHLDIYHISRYIYLNTFIQLSDAEAGTNSFALKSKVFYFIHVVLLASKSGSLPCVAPIQRIIPDIQVTGFF